MKVILNSDKIDEVITALAKTVASQGHSNADIAIIGIRSRGEVLAQRLGAKLNDQLGRDVPVGTLDITLYRDDLNNPQSETVPEVRSTEIDFDINDKIVILADDVLYTGRSTRAAMDALNDFGRPSAIKLAVLIDRGGRELPIQADFAGHKIDVAEEKSVQVRFVESDGTDEVIIE